MNVYCLGDPVKPNLLGGKADAWVLLHNNGLLVPDGFCIPADQPLSDATVETGLNFLRTRKTLRSVAVRSSGIGEDSAETALAGLFETVLNVEPTASAVLAAAHRCRAAGRSTRTTAALGQETEIAVLVQEMVSPSVSGVLFSRDPHTGAIGALVEVVRGHLNMLVSGQSDAQQRLYLADPPTETDMISIKERKALNDIATQTEKLLHTPSDIEWASVGDRIIVLQARPIIGQSPIPRRGLHLIPLDESAIQHIPTAALHHDKVELRLRAARLGISISNGFIGLANEPTPDEVSAAADQLLMWGEFMAVLLDPLHLHNEIHRKLGTGATAIQVLKDFCAPIQAQFYNFSFLVKELQETATTGIAVLLPKQRVRVEAIHGHFITKGFEDPRVYELDENGKLSVTEPGSQMIAVAVLDGKKHQMPVSAPVIFTESQLNEIRTATLLLCDHYPDAGIEFGYTPQGHFFLIDLYRSHEVRPPIQRDVLSEGFVTGRIRILKVENDAIDASIECHIHSRRERHHQHGEKEPEIIVVARPYHLLDELVYTADRNTIGFIFDGGSVLCHLAVILRERGIPALIQRDATKTLRDGDMLTIDTRRTR